MYRDRETKQVFESRKELGRSESSPSFEQGPKESGAASQGVRGGLTLPIITGNTKALGGRIILDKVTDQPGG